MTIGNSLVQSGTSLTYEGWLSVYWHHSSRIWAPHLGESSTFAYFDNKILSFGCAAQTCILPWWIGVSDHLNNKQKIWETPLRQDGNKNFFGHQNFHLIWRWLRSKNCDRINKRLLQFDNQCFCSKCLNLPRIFTKVRLATDQMMFYGTSLLFLLFLSIFVICSFFVWYFCYTHICLEKASA